ncbi:MFS transporter [Candidatus Dojkabacteria bacterium]|uniref:MFS transporter n=1 Tax=Candidatus Dojkabacteria bacterium TaxID=2099670 RepID=A0A955L7U8_9BACT|nr:MFS transporter [Candidatus Dojkabacteria bacterium]
MKEDRNTKIFKLLQFVSYPVFWQPVLFLFLTIEKSLPASQALLLTSIYSLAVVFLEIPTGAVADKLSRKQSGALGYFLKGLGLFLLPFLSSFPSMVGAMVITALGESLTSGSIESLMYDSLADKKDTKQFKKIFAFSRTLLHAAMALYMLLGGIIGEYNLSIPLYISFPFYCTAAILCLYFYEPKGVQTARDGYDTNYLQHIKKSFTKIFSKEGFSHGLGNLLIANFFILGIISSLFWLSTPVLSDVGFGLALIGVFTALFRVTKSIGSYLVTKFDDPNDYRTMIITAIITMFSLALMGYFVAIDSILFGILIVVLFGILYAIQSFYQANNIQLLNDKVESIERATINSIQSVFMRLYEFSILPFVGLFLEGGNSSGGLYLLALLTGIGVFILLINRSRIVRNAQ